MQNMSEAAIEELKVHEGLRLKAYADPVGVWTIGWGHTRNVQPHDSITLAEAHSFLMMDIADAEECVRNRTLVPLTQGQFDALVSFAFNVGCGAFGRSTMLRMLNQKDYQGAADQFPRWNRAGGRVLRGLSNRRQDERRRFIEEVA